MKLKQIIPKEDDECFALVEYLEWKGLKFTHIANETFTKFWSVKNKNKKLGVRSGFPDYIIIVKNKILCIEMKRKKGGAISENQQNWIDELNKCKDVYAVVCYGFDEAKNVIDKYLKINK